MLVRPVRDMDVDLKEIKDYLSAADLQTVIGRFHQAHSFSPRAHPESASFYLGALQSPCRRPGVLSWSLPVLLLHRIASSTHSIPQFVIVNGMIAQIPLATFEQDLDKMPAPVSVPWRQSSVYLCFGEAERAHGNIAYMLKVETRFPSDGSILPALVKPTCCHYDLRSEDGSAMWACVKVYWREQRDSDIVTFYVKGGDMELELMTSHDLKKRGIDPNQPLLEEVVAHHLRQRAFPNAFLSKSKGIVAQGRMAISEGWDLVVRVRCAHLLLGRRYCLSVGVERSRD
jgi:hypothetical protein